MNAEEPMSPRTDDEYVRSLHEAAAVGGASIFAGPDIPDGQPFAQEWKTFKREVSRLLAEGHRGRFAVIKGNEIVSIWDTVRDAEQAARERFGPETLFVQEVQLFVRPLRWGYWRPCRD